MTNHSNSAELISDGFELSAEDVLGLKARIDSNEDDWQARLKLVGYSFRHPETFSEYFEHIL